jgi:hypothetical protein
VIIAAPIWEHDRMERDPRLAFVIMPFRPKWSGYLYADIFKPALSAAGLHPQRADEMMGRNVLQDIWRAIYASRVIIADVTEQNANVYYELGIAHTLGKPTILLTQSIDAVPFDLRHQRLISYSDDLPGYRKIERELPRHLASILSEPVDEIYHIRSVYGGYIVDRAFVRLTLLSEPPHSADVVDEMNIIGVRENVPLVNKVFEHVGTVTGMTCNHHFARSTTYADVVRHMAVFDPPFLQVGARERVVFNYRVENGFPPGKRRWNYDIAVECARLEFELRTPLDFAERVRVVQHIKPTDHTLQLLSPEEEEGQKVFRGTVEAPADGATYSLVWDREQ